MVEEIIRFKRKIYDTMLKWKQERNGDTALTRSDYWVNNCDSTTLA